MSSFGSDWGILTCSLSSPYPPSAMVIISARIKEKKSGDGLVAANGAVFQIDGNLGVVAGVNEVLLQSHLSHR